MSGASGNAVCYNFNTDSRNTQSAAYVAPGFNANHWPHGIMNLWEGNVGEGFQADGYHGSASHQTVFRNWFHGMSTNSVHHRMPIDLPRAEYYFNVVGNVLGWTWATNTSVEYEMTGEPQWYNDTGCIYRLGYPNMGNNSLKDVSPVLVGYSNYVTSFPDTKVTSTLIRHGNYDFKSATQVWDGRIPDHSIPNSYFYTNKPAFFGNLRWPPFDPANPMAAASTNIPAGYRYIMGTEPPLRRPLAPTWSTNSAVGDSLR